jgi:hypothetical protein
MKLKLGSLGILGVLVAVLALVMLTGGTLESTQVIRANQYSDTVNLFIENRWLRLVAPSDNGVDGPKRAAPLIRFEPPEDPAQAAIAREFYEKSFLKGDVQAFNNARSPQDLLVFHYVGEQLARIDPNAHVSRPPQARRGRWTGQLLYAPSTVVRNLSLQAVDASDPSVEVEELCEPVVNESHRSRIELFTGKPASDPRGAIVRFDAPGTGLVAELWRMGNGILLKMQAGPSADVSVRINGRLLEKSPGQIFHLPRDAVLVFEDTRVAQRGRDRRHAWIVRDSDDPDVIYDARGRLWRNAGRNPLMPRVVRVLSSVAANETSDVGASVTLTLLRSMDQSAAEILRKNADPNGSGVARAPAAITLMDANTGALLALPSWPEIDDRSLADLDAESAPANHNFTRLAIGSVAKVLVAAPILDTDPRLLSLKLQPRDGTHFDSVLGIPLGRAIKDSRPGQELDLHTGLYASSNRYAISLLTIGSADPGLATDGRRRIESRYDWYSLGGKPVGERPPHLLFEPDGRDPPLSVQSLKWVERLTNLFDVYSASMQQDRVTRQYIWSHLPPSLRPRQGSRLLDTISPEYENLRLEAIRRAQFTTGFVSVVLGGGESRWTNVAVAEAFATLVRNRPVRAFVVSASKEQRPDPTRGQGWRPLKREVHEALTQALTAVPSRGTARSVLNDTRSKLAAAACARNEAFALLGKTGTPELEESVRSPGAVLFNQMADDGLFEWGKTTRQVSYNAFSRSPLTATDLAALSQRRRSGEGLPAEHFRKYFENPSEAVRESARRCRVSLDGENLWNAVMREIIVNHNLAPEDGTVRVIGKSALQADDSCVVREGGERFGSHFAFVAAVYGRDAVIGGARTDCSGGEPARIDFRKTPRAAVAGVVAMTDPQLSNKAALNTTEALLLGPVARHLGLGDGAASGKAR